MAKHSFSFREVQSQEMPEGSEEFLLDLRTMISNGASYDLVGNRKL